MLRGNLVHKAAGTVGAGAAEQHALIGAGEVQLLLGTGHGHVAQAALLLHLLRLSDGPDTGEDALLGPHHKDHRELQPLGRVHGHHHHAVLIWVVAVQVGVQGDLIQEARQGGLLPRILQIAVDGGEQLPHVFQTGPVLHGVLALQHHGVTGAGDELLIEVGQGHGLGLLGQLPHHSGELGQLSRRPVQFGVHPRVVDDGKEGHPLPPGDLLGGLHRLGPDATGRVVDDPSEAQVVLRVVQHRQIGDHVLDLRPVEEAGAPDDAVGDAVALERLLHLVGLGVHPVENGVVLPVPALAVILQDTGGHILGLVIFVHGGVELELLPLPRPGPQFLALAALVVADDGVGCLQDVAGGAVVLLQPDDPAALVLLLKGEDVLDGGSPEAVDGLVIVPYHAEVLISPRQGGGQQILEIVGVLILVDEHIAEFPLIEGPHVLVLLEQADRVEDDVVKVQGAGLPQPALVLHVHLGDLGQAEIPRPLAVGQILLRQLHSVFGPGDVAQHGPGRELLFVDIQVLQAVLHHPQGVVGVIDGKGGGEAQLLDVPAQDAHTGGVEGGGPDVIGGWAQHPLQPLLQLTGSLVGEGDSQDGPGGGGLQAAQCLLPCPVSRAGGSILLQEAQVILRHPLRHLRAVGAPAVFHQVGDAVDEHGGLSTASPGQQQQRPLGGQHRPLLLRVQMGELPGDGPPAGLGKSQFLFLIQHISLSSVLQFHS